MRSCPALVSHPTATHLLDHLYLPIEASRPTLDQGHIGCQTHLVHMATRVQVVEGIEDKIESLEPLYVELRIFDVRVVSL